MSILDLTHPITPTMPVYPGTEPPILRRANTVECDGFAETLLEMSSHTGTHIDAPAHMVAGGATLDRLPVGRFVGQACVVDVSRVAGREVGTADLERHEALMAGCGFVLLHTGWARYWGDERYFGAFPVLSGEAAGWLAARGLQGVGLDAISVDPVGAREFPNHMVFFAAGLILVENLTRLDTLIGRRFLFSCLPLAYQQADGSPVRAVALTDD
jgi:arylformamidase